MAVRNYSNTAQETALVGGITPSATSVQVAGVSGFPVSTPFLVALDVDTASEELVLVTMVAGTTLTVTRGYDSTTAVTHSAGAVVRHVHAAIDFREANAHVNATTGVHGATGALVDVSAVQTLTNKDLSSGTNTFPTTLATLSGVQTLTSKNLSSGTNTFPTSLATLTGVQTLTNKTLTTPTINTPTITNPIITLSGIATREIVVGPTAPAHAEGRVWVESDSASDEVWISDGAAWKILREDTGWTSFGAVSGWTIGDSAYKRLNGKTIVLGALTRVSGANPTSPTFVTLPAGYKPEFIVPIIMRHGSTAVEHGIVNPDGTVVMDSATVAAAATIRFYVEFPAFA